jgi:hypothetical protein
LCTVPLKEGFLIVFHFSPANHYSTIPQLFHEMYDSPDQAAHYHTVTLNLGASYVTWHMAGLSKDSLWADRQIRG